MTHQLIGRHAGKVCRGDGSLYLERLFVADTWWSRFRGLQFLPELPERTGLMLEPCRSVHTFWMRFRIHVIFLDADRQVVAFREGVSPWRVVLPRRPGIESVLEVPATMVVPRIGEQLTFSLSGTRTGPDRADS